MKKLLVLIGILVIIIAGICGCVTEEKKEKKEEKEEEKEENEINVELTLGEMKYTIRLDPEGEDPLGSKDGFKFFEIVVTARNIDKYSHTISPDDFSLEDSNSNTYSVLTVILEPGMNQFEEINLSMAASTSGRLVFEIPESSTPSKLHCDPAWSEKVTKSIDSEQIQEEIKVSVSASLENRTQYYKIDIVKVSGGTLTLDDAEFKCITKAGTQLYEKTYTQGNPSSLTLGDSTVYPIPSGSAPVNENATTGDGETIDSESINSPHIWENCYFAYLDAQTDDKISSGDTIWIYKDYNDDGIDEIASGNKFKIRDADDNEVLIKEF